MNKSTNKNNNKIYFKCKLIQLVYNVLTWIHKVFITKDLSEYQSPKVFCPLLVNMDRVFMTRGHTGLIDYCKSTRGQLMNYLSGNSEKFQGVRTTRDGLPISLGDLIPLVRREDSPALLLPLLTTILWCTRALNKGKLPNINPITQPCSVTVPRDIGKYTRAFWRDIGFWPSRRLPKGLAWKQFHFTTKSGPNGQALATSLQDLYSLPSSLVESICVVGGEKLSKIVQVLLDPDVQPLVKSWFSVPPGDKLRKVVYFPDKELKVRVIAILDYFSQTCLRPLHGYLLRVLRKIPQDCTFQQGSFIEKCKDWDVYYSVDLSSATDRFPISLITSLLKAKLPEDYVSHWENIMVGYPFEFRKGKQIPEMISYAVGNPMGAYSSWCSFALANHYVVYYCCRELKMNWSNCPYVLLGDDILIGDKDVAELYIRTIKSLGVEISELKTHRSNNFAEFAKRLLYKGQEISPFPISALKSTSKSYYLLVSLLLEQENREWCFREGIPEAVESFYTFVKPLRRKRRSVIKRKAEISEHITRVMRRLEEASVIVNIIARQLEPDSPHISEEESKVLFSSLIEELFRESDPTTSGARGSLGGLALQSLITMTSDERFYSILSSAGFEAHFIPILQVYGLVEEKWLELRQRGIDITDLGEDWPLTLRSFMLPISDKVFVMKSKDLRSHASATLGNRLEKRVKELLLSKRNSQRELDSL